VRRCPAAIVNAELALAMGAEVEARERIDRALRAAWEASRLARELAVGPRTRPPAAGRVAR
jgi:hypothetical protein